MFTIPSGALDYSIKYLVYLIKSRLTDNEDYLRPLGRPIHVYMEVMLNGQIKELLDLDFPYIFLNGRDTYNDKLKITVNDGYEPAGGSRPEALWMIS